MNVILFKGEINQTLFVLSPEQSRHVIKILKLKVGDYLRIGLVNGPLGTGKVVDLDPNGVRVERVEWTVLQPRNRPWHVVLALPRPPVFRRVLQILASLGVKGITVVNADKVEQSFWQSQVLQPSTIDHNLCLGMEQGVVTYKPPIECLTSFTTLIERVRDGWNRPATYWVLDPSGPTVGFPADLPSSYPNGSIHTHHLFIGPEGGWSGRELALFSSLGIQAVSLGNNILKVEVAVAYVAGMLFQACMMV